MAPTEIELADSDRTETLRLLKESASAFAVAESPLSRARALRQCDPDFSPEFWRRLAGQGWTGMLVDEQCGGFGLGFADMATVIEQFAARVAPEPLVPTAVFAARLLQGCPGNELRTKLLSAIAGGDLIAAVAWQEHPAQTDPRCIKTQATPDSRGVKLAGEKRFVRPGTACGGFAVSALIEGEFALYWMPNGSAGLAIEAELQADGTRASRLRLESVRLDAGQCIARGEAAAAALARAYDETLVMASVELVALSRAMLAMTLDYLRTRRQFGRLIGSFQGLQHRAVDLYIQQELAGALVAEAVKSIDDTPAATERAAMASRAKARASDTALAIARESVQMHGAIGFADDYDLGLYFNRALVLSAWLGNGLAHRRRFAAQHPLRPTVAV